MVGGGTVAQRRLPLLVASGADVHVITRAATPRSRPSTGITLTLREFRDGDLDGAWYAIAATDDPDVNAAIVAEAERRHVFCVRADIAVEGHRGHAGDLRLRRAVGRRAGRRRAPPVGGHPHRDPRGAAAGPHRRWTRPTTPGVTTAAVALVGGGPGDPELITVRGRRLLAHADVVVADRLAPQELLAELSPDVEVIDAAKIPYGRAMAQDAINEVLIDAGARRASSSSGSRAATRSCSRADTKRSSRAPRPGIPVTVVPGVTSAIAVPALAGDPGHPPGGDARVRGGQRTCCARSSRIVSQLGCAGRDERHNRAADGRRAHRAVRPSSAGRRSTCGYPGSGGPARDDLGAADFASDTGGRPGTDSIRRHQTPGDHRDRGRGRLRGLKDS